MVYLKWYSRIENISNGTLLRTSWEIKDHMLSVCHFSHSSIFSLNCPERTCWPAPFPGSVVFHSPQSRSRLETKNGGTGDFKQGEVWNSNSNCKKTILCKQIKVCRTYYKNENKKFRTMSLKLVTVETPFYCFELVAWSRDRLQNFSACQARWTAPKKIDLKTEILRIVVMVRRTLRKHVCRGT